MSRIVFIGEAIASIDASSTRIAVSIRSFARCGQIFLIAYLFQPLDDLAVERLLNCDVAHAGCRRRPVPMFFAGRAHDDIAGADFRLRTAPTLHPAAASGNDQPLAQRVGMPRGAGARVRT